MLIRGSVEARHPVIQLPGIYNRYLGFRARWNALLEGERGSLFIGIVTDFGRGADRLFAGRDLCRVYFDLIGIDRYMGRGFLYIKTAVKK
jgi:hypothetical protein